MMRLSGWTRFVLLSIAVFIGLIAMYRAGWVAPFLTYPGMLIAMSAGFLGATFSMLIKNQQRLANGTLEDLISASSWPNLIVRGSVGLGAALILYFFFESGLLTGNLWPELTELKFNRIGDSEFRVPNQNWCLLIIWCFLAGFSEKLVPNMLQKTEQTSTSG